MNVRQLGAKICATENIKELNLMMAAGSSPIILAAACTLQKVAAT